MLSTRQTGWTSLQSLQSHLAGRLGRFRRNNNAGIGLSRQAHNDTAFFEADLRYIFTIIPTITDIPDNRYDELNQTSHNLLTALDGMINQVLIDAFEAPGTEEPEVKPHDTSLGDCYPQLCSVLTLLKTSTGEVNLATGQDSPLFILPEDQTRSVALECLTHMKEVLERFANSSRTQQLSQLNQLPPTEFTTKEPSWGQYGVQNNASLVKTLFKNVRQHNCGKSHQMKLKVPDDWKASPWGTTLDMFLSCCLDQGGWHRTKCGNWVANSAPPKA